MAGSPVSWEMAALGLALGMCLEVLYSDLDSVCTRMTV